MHACLVEFAWYLHAFQMLTKIMCVVNSMNPEKLARLQAQVRTGGKGSVRRKKKAVHKTTTTGQAAPTLWNKPNRHSNVHFLFA